MQSLPWASTQQCRLDPPIINGKEKYNVHILHQRHKWAHPQAMKEFMHIYHSETNQQHGIPLHILQKDSQSQPNCIWAEVTANTQAYQPCVIKKPTELFKHPQNIKQGDGQTTYSLAPPLLPPPTQTCYPILQSINACHPHRLLLLVKTIFASFYDQWLSENPVAICFHILLLP